MPRPSNAPLIHCTVCGKDGNQDAIMRHACLECASKFRAIDLRAASVAGIRKEMHDIGIPVQSVRGNQWKSD